MERFHQTSLSLQTSTLNLNVMVSLLESLVDFINNQRTEFEHFRKLGILQCGHDQYNSAIRRVRVRSCRYDGENTEDSNLSPKDRFKQEVFLVINDQLISNLKHRLGAYKEINHRFGFLSILPSLSTEKIKQAATTLTCSYPNDLEPTIESELVQFSSLMALELQTSIEQIKPRELKMYEFLHKQSLTQTFPNIEIALRIYLSLMVSSCSGERSFSKLKRIKNELRNRIGQDRLNNLSIMSIESDILRGLDFSKIIDDFSQQKCRKRPF